MNDALIGHTGFVGGNLIRQRVFKHFYNSKNSGEMRGRSYGLVMCSGVSAVKWMANKEPEKDREGIKRLEDVLRSIRAERFVLISTIDVYPVLEGADEDHDCHAVGNHPYGEHRLAFEDFCVGTFPDCTVVRLPGLFGEGLKKNVIYDLLNDNCLEMVNPESRFQYYGLDDLWADVDKALENGVRKINLFTEPVRTGDVLDAFFPSKEVGARAVPAVRYDLRTRHSGLWGRDDGYVQGRDGVMDRLGRFIDSRPRRGGGL